jgi:FkbH-like protein
VNPPDSNIGQPAHHDSETRYALSRFALETWVADRCVLVDALHLGRVVLAREIAQTCLRLRDHPMTVRELDQYCPPGVDGATLFALLRGRGLLVAEGADQEAEFGAVLDTGASLSEPSGARARWTSWRYWQPRVVGPPDVGTALRDGPAPPAARSPLRVLLVGTCLLQFAEDALTVEGLSRGFEVHVRHEWLDSMDSLEKVVEQWDPHVAVFQPTTQAFMAGLWDDGPLRAPRVRQRRARSLNRLLASYVRDFARILNGRLGLVHNFAAPAVSPFGRFDFRVDVNFRRVIAEVNGNLDAAVGAEGNLMLIDEERLAARHGTAGLFDELVFPFAHHGGRPDPDIEIPNQTGPLSSILATEYLDCYAVHKGTGRIKCVVTDLDGTLWPGIAVQDGFGWLDDDVTSRWMHLGLQQALRLLKERGILLATSSKGTEAETLAAWRTGGAGMGLSPGDFVLHRINWGPKSEAIADICARVGLAEESVLFLDDNPVERAEVRARMPGVQVYDGPVHTFRAGLLLDPRLEATAATHEARQRTATTKAMIARDELAAATDREAFLKDLNIRVDIREAGPAQLPRVVELLNRANQFNTTGRRVDPTRIAALGAASDARVLTMAAADRFADYGLVGVLIVEDDTISAMAMSCRVIGLDVAVPFLVTALTATGLAARPGLRGVFVTTAHNAPAKGVFAKAGFTPAGPGAYVLGGPQDLVDVTGGPHTVTFHTLATDSPESEGSPR